MSIDAAGFVRGVQTNGWAITGPVIAMAEVDLLRSAIARRADETRGGRRNLLDVAAVRGLATRSAIRALAGSVLGGDCFATRAILFDKTPTSNWKVIWHQDLTIATAERVPVAGFGPWTEKGGVPHVQPPVEVLEAMLAIRVHLDDCSADNGPVRVITGTHLRGRLSPEAIEHAKEAATSVECIVAAGGVLAFRPLLLHASSAARVPSHRRVIHIEFAAVELPPPLRWHRRIAEA